LHLVDHEALRAQQARQAQQAAAAAAGAPPPPAPPSGSTPSPTPVYLFRSWEPELEAAQHQHALKALRKCDWGGHGFSLASAGSTAGAGWPGPGSAFL
jgi:hypothetical protein